MCFYEMCAANSLVRSLRQKNTDALQPHKEDLPIAAQLLGSDPDTMLKAAKILLEINENISFIDINAACPVKKAIKNKTGAYLIKEPEMLYTLINKLSASLSLPITVKLRTGYLKKDEKRIARIAKNCEENGAKTIFVHGRTQAQMYSGGVDYESIRAIKDSVKIPVIASGNIFSAQDAKAMIDKTGCDGLLIARGALGNPWIFAQINTYLKNGKLLPGPTLEEKLAAIKKHLQLIEKYKMAPDKIKLGVSRKVAAWYLKGFDNAAALRDKVGRSRSMDELYQNLF
jgi:tRNA-dihydrouridine synthase B